MIAARGSEPGRECAQCVLGGRDLCLEARRQGARRQTYLIAASSSVWITAALEAPLGRGVNFQLAVPDLQPVLERLNVAGWPLFGGLEERWYRTGARETGVRQFLIQDPDGYLVRPQQTLGSRPVQG